jgi:alpha-tubulin suppressor-like RCC1 family protein
VWVWGEVRGALVGSESAGLTLCEPVLVEGVSDVVQIGGSFYATYAVTADGSVWAWGSGAYGAVGTGTNADVVTPTRLEGLSGVVAVTGGSASGYALTNTGDVWGWGANSSGELGLGVTTSVVATPTIPTRIPTLSGVVDIAATTSTMNSAYALLADGTVMSWGGNNCGALGASMEILRATPAPVPGLINVVDIAAGYNTAYALKSDGTVWAWGCNDLRQISDESWLYQLSDPLQIGGLSGVGTLAAGAKTAAAILADGAVTAWGLYPNGAYGGPALMPGLEGETVVSLSLGDAGFALLADGQVRGWGENTAGQIGDGSVASSATAVPVRGLSGISSVTALDGRSYAIQG